VTPYRAYAYAIAAHVGFILLWQLVVMVSDIPAYILPSPLETIREVGEGAYNWSRHISVTGLEIFGGYTLAVVVGVALAVLFVWIPALNAAPSNLCVIGRYILLPEVFRHLDEKKPGAGGEIQLTDAMARMIGHTPFHGVRFAGVRFDCGDKLGYLKANVAFALERPDLAGDLAAYLNSLVLN